MLTDEKGVSVAEAWFRGARRGRDSLTSGTRLMPIQTRHRALAGFAEGASRDAIPRASRLLVAPEALGVWVRVLRGTTAPGEAFARLDTTDSQHGRTTRWESLDSSRDRWRGRLSAAHDPALEQDGLLVLGRLAELAAIPALFGYSGARARALPGDSKGVGIVQEFEVDWVVPTPLQTLRLAAPP